MLSSPEKEIPGSREDCLYIDERCVQGAGLMAPKDSAINNKSMYNFGGKRGQLTQDMSKQGVGDTANCTYSWYSAMAHHFFLPGPQ